MVRLCRAIPGIGVKLLHPHRRMITFFIIDTNMGVQAFEMC